MTVEKTFDTPSQFSLKTLKNIYLKLYLTEWYIFLCTLCTKFGWYIIYLQFTKIKPVSKILNWTAPVTYIPPITLCNFYLISEIVLLFTVKTTNALCWLISKETKSFLSFLALSHVALYLCIRKSSVKYFPARISPKKSVEQN